MLISSVQTVYTMKIIHFFCLKYGLLHILFAIKIFTYHGQNDKKENIGGNERRS